jgi:predicted acylesterase/phospholipase RssA
MQPKPPGSKSIAPTAPVHTTPMPPPSLERDATTTPPGTPDQFLGPQPPATETAVVITGAVAQGAFAAGALEVLARLGVPINRVVATSAGALTGTVLAAGIYAGRVEQATAGLVDLWTRDAHWRNALDLSPRDLLRGRGLSTTGSLRRVLRTAVESIVPGHREPVELRLIATALLGNPRVRAREFATSAETVFRFVARDFETRDRRERIYDAATASAAFPGLYAPVHVPGVGDCIDGGAVNNAAIKHALDHSNVGRVIVIANTPRLAMTPPGLSGASLGEHIAATLIHERLYRDLREARMVNHQLDGLRCLVEGGMLDARQLAAVKLALGWGHKRMLDIIEIRPADTLRGGAFTGLANRSLREEYIEAGRCAAQDALSAFPSIPRDVDHGPYPGFQPDDAEAPFPNDDNRRPAIYDHRLTIRPTTIIRRSAPR